MAHHSESYPDKPFSPWRPNVWHLWLAAPLAAAVAVVLTFYVAL